MADSVETPGVDSPLAEASSTSLDELFSRNPLDLTDNDVEKIVREFRAKRALWLDAEAKGAKRAPGAKAAAKAKLDTDGKSTDDLLKDLGL